MDESVYGVNRLYPNGTNSTMFTSCCGVAICEDEGCCPKCGSLIIGHNAESREDRRKIRWDYATSHWGRGR